MQLDKPCVEILHILIVAAALLTERHDIADKLVRRNYRDLDVRLVRLGNARNLRIIMRVIDHDNAAVGLDYLINNARKRGDKLQIELALQPLLNYLHMQHSEEAAAEAEAERDGAFRLVRERSVVELQLIQRVAQVGVLRAVLGVDAAVDHRARRTVAGQLVCGGILGAGNSVAHLRVCNVFDAGCEIADISRGQFIARIESYRAQVPQLHDLVLCAGGHEQYLILAVQHAVHHAHENDDAAVVVVLAVEYQRLERCVRVARRRRDVPDDIVQHRVDVQADLRAYLRRILRGDADYLLDLVLDALRVGGGKVDLVDNGQYLKVVIQREIGVRQCLRLDALRRVHDQHRALAGRERTADLIVEVDVPRRVDEVEGIVLPVCGVIVQPDGARLYRDAALALKIHVVEYLILHHALLHRAALLDKAVGQRGFAVIDMGDYGKIAYQLLISHRSVSCFKLRSGQRALRLADDPAQPVNEYARRLGGLPVSGRPAAAAEQVVGGHAVVVAHAADEGKPRLARAVFIVAQQRLTYAEVGRGLALADIFLPAQRRERLGKGSVHCFSLLSL